MNRFTTTKLKLVIESPIACTHAGIIIDCTSNCIESSGANLFCWPAASFSNHCWVQNKPIVGNSRCKTYIMWDGMQWLTNRNNDRNRNTPIINIPVSNCSQQKSEKNRYNTYRMWYDMQQLANINNNRNRNWKVPLLESLSIDRVSVCPQLSFTLLESLSIDCVSVCPQLSPPPAFSIDLVSIWSHLQLLIPIHNSCVFVVCWFYGWVSTKPIVSPKGTLYYLLEA